MASTRDVQDMLGLVPSAGPKPKPAKKKPKSAKGEGVWNKELRSLIGERAPPAHLLEAQPKFQKKRVAIKSGPVRRWHHKAFGNDARTDGLVLRHWRRTELESKPFSRDGESASIPEDEEEKIKAEFESADGPEYKFGAKYNPQVDVPAFDHETYERSLQSDDWTEAETRYLVESYRDFYGKWSVIWDRYEWDRSAKPADADKPAGADSEQLRGEGDASEASQIQPGNMDVDGTPTKQDAAQEGEQRLQASPKRDAPKPRSMEELKHRFYNVSAAVLAIQTPPTQMTASQYRLHEQMTRFNINTETQRKRFKEIQMTRSKEEKREEEFLLAELKRIYFGQERVDTDLRELRGRLDHGLTDDRNPGQQYTSSRELQDVFNRFIRKENMIRPPGTQQPGGPRRSLPGQPDMIGSAGSPTGSLAAAGQKKGGMASSAEGGAHATVRQLTPRAAAKNGVSNHERLTSGVSFRSDRISKIRQPSKSIQVNNKISGVLTQIDVPEYVLMPTVSVTRAVESVVSIVSGLVEIRRGRERVEGEVKVLEKMLGIEQKPDEGGADEADGGTEDADKKEDYSEHPGEEENEGEQQDGQAEQDAEGSPDEDGDDPAAGDSYALVESAAGGTEPSGGATVAAMTRHKRSASVLSTSSTGSRAGMKRQKSARK